MIRDLNKEMPTPGERFDVCIVGAGAAGIVMAVELVRRGKRVVVVEAGGAEIEEAAQEAYRSEVTGLPHKGVEMGRFRVHGGTTRKWGGQILELDAADFERREWVPGSGWPLSKEDLQPYYDRALELEGLSGATLGDESVWREAGETVPVFKSLEMYFSRWCPEPDFSLLHRESLEGEGLQVWLHASAVQLQLEGERVEGLRCQSLEGRGAVFRAEAYVFCLGAIESSRFFLQPRESGLPWNESGLLGTHFQDHIDCNAARVHPVDARRFHRVFDNVFSRGYKYHPKVKLSPAVQRFRKTLNVAATMNFISGADKALSDLKGTAKKLMRGSRGGVSAKEAVGAIANSPLLARQMWRYGVRRRAYNPADAAIWLRVHCEQEPESGSSISLSGERDSLGMWRTRLDWRISEVELRTIREFVSVAAKSLGEVARIEPDEELMGGGDGFARRCDDSNHHMGGMRMGQTPRQGIVDVDLKLYGTQNCYVCSGAVFPTSGFSNPTHTVIALAVRLAERLAR